MDPETRVGVSVTFLEPELAGRLLQSSFASICLFLLLFLRHPRLRFCH